LHSSKPFTNQTIKVYLAAIQLLHLEQGFEDPTRDTPLLTYLCIGIRHTGRSTNMARLPITIPLLRVIKQQLSTSTFPAQVKLLYWAAFTLAFYGFLRASEYSCPTQSKFTNTRHLLRDISITTNSLSIHLKHSKSDCFGRSGTVLVGATGSSTCPVLLLSTGVHQPSARLS